MLKKYHLYNIFNMEITIFKTLFSDTPFHMDVSAVLLRIKEGNSKDIVAAIRKCKSKEDRQQLKKKLPAILFSGKFNKRTDANCLVHSGLVCLDFDGFTTKKEMLKHKSFFCSDSYTMACFISPSGKGLKVVVKIPDDPKNHVNFFNGLKEYFDNPFFDTTSKNLSRVCYESHDPEIYINMDSQEFSEMGEVEAVQMMSYEKTSIPITDQSKIIEILIKWWERKFPMMEGQRNHNAYVLAAAMNDYGINQDTAMYVLRNYESVTFDEREIRQTVDSAYRDLSKFGTKQYSDTEKMSEYRLLMRKGVKGKDIKKRIANDTDLSPEAADAVIKTLEEEVSDAVFWSVTDRGKVSIDSVEYFSWLQSHGYNKYIPDDRERDSFLFVHVHNNLVDLSGVQDIKDFTLQYLRDQKVARPIENYFYENVKIYTPAYLSGLDRIEITFMEDTKDTSYVYYQNCVVKVTKDEMVAIDYLSIDGYVWKERLIDRVYRPYEVEQNHNYIKFLKNISHTKERFASMCSTIGFLMSGYKERSYCPAVILNDERIAADGSANGGTGKGIFCQAISHMRRSSTIDGKSFDPHKTFAFQNVTIDTQVLLFDDARQRFPFESLFSIITEGVKVEKKNQHAIQIDFEDAPKIIITTNYAIKGKGNSFERRKWELEFHQYYTKDFTPQDEFGRMLFSDWGTDDWSGFDNFMLSCLQLFLTDGFKSADYVNLGLRKLSAETNHDFIEWCGLLEGDTEETNPALVRGARLPMKDLYYKFTENYPDYARTGRLSISQNAFYKWIISYADYIVGSKSYVVKRDALGKYIYIKTDKEIVSSK